MRLSSIRVRSARRLFCRPAGAWIHCMDRIPGVPSPLGIPPRAMICRPVGAGKRLQGNIGARSTGSYQSTHQPASHPRSRRARGGQNGVLRNFTKGRGARENRRASGTPQQASADRKLRHTIHRSAKKRGRRDLLRLPSSEVFGSCARNYFAIACATATATSTEAPTIGLLPMPISPIISTCAGTDEDPANCASECIRPIVSVMP